MPGMIIHSTFPLNAEPPLSRLGEQYLTPAASCYIRTHGAVPEINRDDYRVRISGLVSAPQELSIADLTAEFETRSMVAVMQCAGNRRADLQLVEKTAGDPWSAGAIANLRWTGVLLADVLRAAGADERDGLSVAFEAADTAVNEGADDALYGASIPIGKALSGEVLLAWGMNDEPLTAEHGAPLRVVVPGYAGVRCHNMIAVIGSAAS